MVSPDASFIGTSICLISNIDNARPGVTNKVADCLSRYYETTDMMKFTNLIIMYWPMFG